MVIRILIHIPRTGAKARLDGPLLQKPQCEAVYRRDRRPVDPVKRIAKPHLPPVVLFFFHLGSQGRPDSPPQLGGGLNRECDGHDPIDINSLVLDEVKHPLNDQIGLARSRARLDEDGALRPVDRQLA